MAWEAAVVPTYSGGTAVDLHHASLGRERGGLYQCDVANQADAAPRAQMNFARRIARRAAQPIARRISCNAVHTVSCSASLSVGYIGSEKISFAACSVCGSDPTS